LFVITLSKVTEINTLCNKSCKVQMAFKYHYTITDTRKQTSDSHLNNKLKHWKKEISLLKHFYPLLQINKLSLTNHRKFICKNLEFNAIKI